MRPGPNLPSWAFARGPALAMEGPGRSTRHALANLASRLGLPVWAFGASDRAHARLLDQAAHPLPCRRLAGPDVGVAVVDHPPRASVAAGPWPEPAGPRCGG